MSLHIKICAGCLACIAMLGPPNAVTARAIPYQGFALDTNH